MQVTKMKHLDRMHIEELIKLPYFYSLKRSMPDAKKWQSTAYWEIIFKCNKITPDGRWQLLDEIFDTEFVTKYKII